VDNLVLHDYHDFLNAVSPNPSSVPAHASFDVRWTAGDYQKIHDPTFGFAGDYRICDASISFAASDDGTGIVYTSDPDGQTTVGAGIGLERNGVFFH
jgi:hypothetical protein